MLTWVKIYSWMIFDEAHIPYVVNKLTVWGSNDRSCITRIRLHKVYMVFENYRGI